jgi:protein TonB
LPLQSATTSAQSTGLKDDATEGALSNPDAAQPQRMKVANGVTAGLLIKRVNPVYPADARSAYIQGTVVLQAEISKTGDITGLELADGPIELAGSAVAAVRQWKYKPYLLMGQPVIVDTQIQVNYQLSR